MVHLAITNHNCAVSGQAANYISEASRTYLYWKGLLLGHLVKLFALLTGPDGWVSSLALNISSFTTSVLATGSTV